MTHILKLGGLTQIYVFSSMGFSGDSVVKNPHIMQETWVQFLVLEDALEKEMAVHSSILAWEIQRTEEPGRLQSMGSQRVRHDLATTTIFSSTVLRLQIPYQSHWANQSLGQHQVPFGGSG